MKTATAEQMKRMDKRAIEERGISSLLLMERAAEGVSREALRLLGVSGAASETGEKEKQPIKKNGRAAVFCGPGNNGGDGVAAARFLKREGLEVRVFLVGKRAKMTGDTKEMERRLKEAGGCLEDWIGSGEQKEWCAESHLLVDAILGIGLHGEVREDTKEVLLFMDSLRLPVVAADVASGVDADTGKILGGAVHASCTVTFTLPKPGHYIGEGALYAGEVKVYDIGIPEDVQNEEEPLAELVTDGLAASWLPKRPADGHKGTFGRVCAVGGSVGLTGAPVFAAKAAARSGSGLVFLGVPGEIYPITASMCMEAMPFPLPARSGKISSEALFELRKRLDSCDAGLLGPGLGRGEALSDLVCRLLEHTRTPFVLDADALYAVKERKELLKLRREKGLVTILTPHEGEFAYLIKDGAGRSLQKKSLYDMGARGRLEAAKAFALTYGCILVLKGPGTIVADPEGRAYLNTTGNDGMAKGGSGDILSGMILSLLGQGMEPVKAAALGVWLHGLAGDLCREELGEYGMLPSDMLERIPKAFCRLSASKLPESDSAGSGHVQ